jgi:hypothetical protein
MSRPVFFVGSEPDLDQAVASFRLWFSAERLRGQEPTYFDTSFASIDRGREGVVAWWALGANVFFTLQKAVALDLLAAVDGGATA